MSERTRELRFWAGVVFAIMMAGAYWFLQVQPLLGDRGTGITGIASHTNDYKHVYLGATLLAEKRSPYDPRSLFMLAQEMGDPRMRTLLPYVYLPFTGFVLTPLTWMPYYQSAVAFQFVNHVALIAGLLIAVRAMRVRANGWIVGVVLAACAFNFGVYRQNNAGQLNALLVLFYAAFLWTYLRHPKLLWLHGFIAAAAMLFKITPGILLIWLLLRRDWLRSSWMLGWALVLTGITVLWSGFSVHMEFLPVLRDMGYGKSTWAEFGQTFWRDPYNQSLNATLHRWFVPFETSPVQPFGSLSPFAANALTWVGSIVVIVVFVSVVWIGRSRETEEDPVDRSASSLAAAICASLLLPSILWDHYLVQLLLPALILAALAKDERARPLLWGTIAAAVAVSALPIRFDSPYFHRGFGLIMGSVKLLPPLALFAMACWFTSRPRAAA